LQAPWVYHVGRALGQLRGAPMSDFHFVPLEREEVQRVFRESGTIVDIEHPGQHGLTMRTIETIGAGKKLITTNAYVQEHDLFHPDNVYVMPRGRPTVPCGFLESPATPLPPAVLMRYSLAGFMNDLLDQSVSSPQ